MTRIRKCCVKNCDDIISKRHRFPKHDESLMEKWIKNIDHPRFSTISKDVIYNTYVVCGKHFSPECSVPGTKRGLVVDAVPTLHLGKTEMDDNEIIIQEESNSYPLQGTSLHIPVMSTPNETGGPVATEIIIEDGRKCNVQNTNLGRPVMSTPRKTGSRASSANNAAIAEGKNSACPTADPSSVTLSTDPQPQKSEVQTRTLGNSACSTSRTPTTSILTKLNVTIESHEQNSRDGETSSFTEGNLSNAEPVQVKVENDDWGDVEDTCEASSLSPEIQDAHHLSGTEPSPHFQNLAENLPSGLQSVLKPDLSVCRLCLGNKEVACSIFSRSDVGQSDNPGIEISDILASIPLTVREGDGLPQKVCQKCYNQLIIWYNFREMCISTDIILKQYISNMSLSADTEPLNCVNDMNTSNQMSGPSDKLESSTCTADVFTIVTEQGSLYESDSRNGMSSSSEENIRLILKEARPDVRKLSKEKVVKDMKQRVSVTRNTTIPLTKAKMLPKLKKRTLLSVRPIHIQALHEVPEVVQVPLALKTPQEDESSIPSKKSRSNNESGRHETTPVDIIQQKTVQKATIVEVHCNVENENNAPPPLEISNVVPGRTVLTDGVKYYTVAHESPPDVTMKSLRGGDSSDHIT